MTHTTIKGYQKDEGLGGRPVTLRPKNLVAGLKPEYVVAHFPATIGRHPVNDVELPFDSVSRYHARLELRGGKLHLVDLRSSNGTFVNGKRVQLAPVLDHDSLAFGSLDFTILFDEEAKEEPSSQGRQEKADRTQTSILFTTSDDNVQTIYHTELPDDTSHSEMLRGDISDAPSLLKAKLRLISLYKLQDVLRAGADEEHLLQNVLNLLFDVLPVDRGAVLMRDDQDPSTFRPAAVKMKAGLAPDERIGVSKTILQRCMKEKVAVLTRDASLDQRFSGAESVVSNRMRSVMCVPLISARHFFGFCHLDTTDSVRSFSEEDLTFLAHVGQEVAIHLHNLRMVQEKIATERMAAIGQTITGMAHNIKNILVLSQGGVEMMEKRLRDRNYETLDETWLVVRRGVDRINKLVQEMLDYSRARKVDRRRIDVNDFLRDLQQSFAEEMAKRRIECALSLDEKVPVLMLDADGLDKSLANLIVNAMEAYEERPGKIELRTRRLEEGAVTIEVEDHAGGIPQEVLPRIFVPFFTTKGSKGSGLGLAMTKKIIEDMGGTIDVRSSSGDGTCFTIALQAGPSSPKPADV